MPTATLPAAYAAKAHQRPSSARTKDSFENVENVVNPPHRPVVARRRSSSLHPNRAAHAPNSPMAKLPMALTASVAYGNIVEMPAIPAPYLNTHPIPPPRKTMRTLVIASIPLHRPAPVCVRQGRDVPARRGRRQVAIALPYVFSPVCGKSKCASRTFRTALYHNRHIQRKRIVEPPVAGLSAPAA